jgi:hypothetical protein
MGTRKIVEHPRSAKMRSTYLFSGWIAGLAVYGIAMILFWQIRGSTGFWSLTLMGIAFLGAIMVGNHVWRRIWKKFKCPGCGDVLPLQYHRMPGSKRWGYQCDHCDTFFDAGISVRNDLG